MMYTIEYVSIVILLVLKEKPLNRTITENNSVEESLKQNHFSWKPFLESKLGLKKTKSLFKTRATLKKTTWNKYWASV